MCDQRLRQLGSAGRELSAKTATIQVDSQAPQPSQTLSGTLGNPPWYISDVQIELIPSDATPSSGRQYFAYTLDGTNWISYTAAIPLSEGVYAFQSLLVDNADHQAALAEEIKIDTSAPEISVTRAGTQGSANFYTSAVTYEMTANDSISGIAKSEYSLDGSAWQSYTVPLTIADGFHELQFRAENAAGLETLTETYAVQIDTHAPGIKLPSRWYLWETGELFVKDETSKIKTVTFIVRDGQNRWKKFEQSWDVNRQEFSHSLSWNRIFGDGVTAPVGTYPVMVIVEDYAGNTSQRTAEIVIPAPNAAPLPTFTPAPTPTNTLPASEAQDESPEMVAVATSTPVDETVILPVLPPANDGDTSSPASPPSPQPLSANDLLAITAAAATGAFVATQRKKSTFTATSEKKTESATASDVAWGSSAATAITNFISENGERMRRARLESKLGKEAEQRKKQARAQAFYDANGAAIYEKNKDPYAGIGDWIERQDRSNAAVIAEYKEKESRARILAAANEIEAEKKIGYVDAERDEVRKIIALNEQKNAPVDSATASYLAMGTAVEAGKFSKEEYDKAKESAQTSRVEKEKKPWWQTNLGRLTLASTVVLTTMIGIKSLQSKSNPYPTSSQNPWWCAHDPNPQQCAEGFHAYSVDEYQDWVKEKRVALELPLYITPPPDVITYDQMYDYSGYPWKKDSAFEYFLYNGCGPVAFCSAAEDQGIMDYNQCITDMYISNEEVSKKKIGRFGFSQAAGVQPNNYVKWIQYTLGESATVTASNNHTLEDINEQLALGNIVIVDYLSDTNPNQEGERGHGPVPAYPYDDGNPDKAVKLYNYNSFAHFARVVGFSQDGQFIILAQTEHPDKYGETITVPVDAFSDAWEKPELRANLGNPESKHDVDADVNNWMVTISPNTPATSAP